MNDDKLKIAFVCVHNSCRSQIAEALGNLIASDKFEFYSAGTSPACEINKDAVRLVDYIYGIDMNEKQYPKNISEITSIDVLITMGCNVECPFVPCKHREDWNLEDPTGKSDSEFIKVIDKIHGNVLKLKNSKNCF